MNNSTCILCNTANLKKYIHADDINAQQNIVKCRRCGLIFFENVTEKKLDDSYWAKKEQTKLYEQSKIQESFSKEFEKRIQAIDQLHDKGRLLDIGCGLGDFLKVAKKDGWEVSGVEISEAAAKYARKSYSLDVQTGTIENSHFEYDSFDVITMWDVIEHIQNPIEALTAIKNRLKLGGLLVIKTPNDKSLFKSISKFFYWVSNREISFLLKYVYYLPHYFYYNRTTMKKILEKCNFKVVKIENEGTDYNFATKKIKLHYKKFISKNLVLIALPMVYFIARILRMQNKMVIYAVKT